MATRLLTLENTVAQHTDAIEDCEKSTGVLLNRVDHSRTEILEKFEKSVVPAIQLNEKLIEATTRLKETETKLANVQVKTETQTTTQTVTVTPAPIPPFWTIIKAWASNVNLVGSAFLTLVLILGVLLAWWIWGVQHTPAKP